MAKRAAEFQMLKDGDGAPDFTFGASPAEAGGIQPQKATAQTMARRRIATGRTGRVRMNPGATPPAPQQPAGFGAQQSPSWSGSFGSTTTTGFGGASTSQFPQGPQGQGQQQQPAAQPFNFSAGFGQANSSSTSSGQQGTFSFGQTQSFGGVQAPSAGAGASSNRFAAANTSNSFPPAQTTGNPFQTQAQPAANGFASAAPSSTGPSSHFQTQPATNGLQPNNAVTPASFAPTPAPITTTSTFAASTQAPSNPFTFTSNQTAAPSQFQTAAAPATTGFTSSQPQTAPAPAVTSFFTPSQLQTAPAPATTGVTTPSQSQTASAPASTGQFAPSLSQTASSPAAAAPSSAAAPTTGVTPAAATAAAPTTAPAAAAAPAFAPFTMSAAAPTAGGPTHSLSQTAPASAAAPAPATAPITEHTMAAEVVDRFKQFGALIEPTFQTMERFKEEVLKQVQAMPSLTASKSADVVAAEFAEETQRLFTAVHDSSTPLTMSQQNMKLLDELLARYVPAHGSAAPAPALEKPRIELSALREMLRNEAKQQLPALLQPSTPAIDANRVKDILAGLFTDSFSTLTSQELPAEADGSFFKKAVTDGVTEAFGQLAKQNAQSALTEAAVRDMFRQAFRDALPDIRNAFEEMAAPQQASSGPATLDEAIQQLRDLKGRCERLELPKTFATPPYSTDKLTEAQKAEYLGGRTLQLFHKGACYILRNFKADPVTTAKIASETERLRMVLAAMYGLKRKADSTLGDGSQDAPNKRMNNGALSATAGDTPLFAPSPTNTASGNGDGPTAAFGSSQTSQLFATMAPNGATAQATATPSPAQNMFAAAAAASKNATNAGAAAAPKPPQFSVPPAAGSNFMAQFQKRAAQTAEQDKAKRKAEDFDSDEETEEEWEKRDAAEQQAKRQKIMAGGSSAGFVFKPTNSEASKDGDADNEDSTEEPSHQTTPDKGKGVQAAESSSTTPKASNSPGRSLFGRAQEGNAAEDSNTTPKAAGSAGRSLFDRVQEGKAAASATLAPNGDKTWKPESPIRFGESTSSLFSGGSSLPASPPQASTAGNASSSTSIFGSNLPNPFAQAATTANAAASPSKPPTVDVTAASPVKATGDKPKNLFQFPSTTNAAAADDKGKAKEPARSIFGGPSKLPAAPLANPFAHLAENPSLFSSPPASASASGSGGLAPTSVFATAGSSRATSPGMTTGDESAGSEDTTPLTDPQIDLAESRAGEENEETLFEVKAKASEFAPQDDSVEGGEREWQLRGVGVLRLLHHKDTGKARMVLRAGPVQRVVLNVALVPSTTYSSPTAKSVAFVASNSGRVAKWTLQVGKAEDAAKLLSLLNGNKAN